MKHIALLIAIAFPAGAVAQAGPTPPPPATPEPTLPALPDNPAPAAAKPSPMWDRIAYLPRGEKIKIRFANGRWERCEFAGATDTYLYCAPPEDSDRVQEWQIERGRIFDFKIDHDIRNGRLVFTAFVVAGGIWGGLYTLHHTGDEGAAVFGGMLGAAMGGIPGVVGSCIAGHCVSIPPPPPPAFGLSFNLPLHRLSRR